MFPDSLPNLKFFLKQLIGLTMLGVFSLIFQRQLSANMTTYIFFASQPAGGSSRSFKRPGVATNSWGLPKVTNFVGEEKWQPSKSPPAFAAILQVEDLLALRHTDMLLSFQQFRQSASPEKKVQNGGFGCCYLSSFVFHII